MLFFKSDFQNETSKRDELNISVLVKIWFIINISDSTIVCIIVCMSVGSADMLTVLMPCFTCLLLNKAISTHLSELNFT